jgi:carboxyl-terminal processing protease
MDNQRNEIKQSKYEIWQPMLLAAMVAFGIFIGYKMNDKDERFLSKIDGDKKIELGRVEEMIRFIETRYVDTLNNNVLIESAINGMLNKLDPHSIYIPPKHVSEIAENMDGSFNGIGIETLTIDDTVTIATLIKDSPGHVAGLQQYDQIVAVNDTTVAGMKLAFDKIRDKLKSNGKTVKLEIKRRGNPHTLIKNIKLGAIPIHSADVAYMINDSLGYIQIKQFSSNTYDEFMKQVEYLAEKKGMRHLAIDLRGNPGGYLPQAVKILNQLIVEKDQLLVYTEGRNHTRQDYKTNGKAFFNLKKIAVLVDENSASGSEVIAGAIQDHDRGIIIGRKSFGKGLVQEQFNLSNGGAIRLTTARYYTPSGRSIQKDFSSLADYEEEAANRSIFKPMKRDSAKSKEYKTLHLGRKVYSGKGIDPEVFIPGDSLSLYSDYYHLQSYDLEFLTKQIMKGKVRKDDKTNFDLLAKDYIVYVNQKSKKVSTDKSMFAAAKRILAERYHYLMSNGDLNSNTKHTVENDPFLKAAAGYVVGKVKL